MPNKFKTALAATTLAGAFIAAGAEIDLDEFELEILDNRAVAEIVTGAVENAKPVEPYTVIALGGGNRGGGEGGRGDGNESKNGGGGHY